jgi:serine/threonine protein kinase
MGLCGFTAELMALKKLHHTNIIRFLGAIYNPSPLTYCLVLEFCDGGDLALVLARGCTPHNFFNNVASGVANGMFYLHKMKFMHRDIKPSNVLLSGDPKSGNFVAKLTDFGLAVKIQNSSVNNGRELTAETGTYRYMAPGSSESTFLDYVHSPWPSNLSHMLSSLSEVIRHERYDYAADIYSFGLLMWEIVTRERPFEPMGQLEAAGSVALHGKRPPFPETMPPSVRDLIEKCWAQIPSERMEVEQIINRLGDLSGCMATESWLAAPSGHPVYKEAPQKHPFFDRPVEGQNVKQQTEKKKASMLKNGLFWKKKGSVPVEERKAQRNI